MILCLDVGNSHIYGGVFDNDKKLLSFRHDTQHAASSDQLGIFLRTVLRENNILATSISQISICSVVPHIDYSLRSACIKYFDCEPFFLRAAEQKILSTKYKNPNEIGADRIANAIAAVNYFPNKNIIIIDFGTATTFCAISSDAAYLGGTIMAGIRLSMESLQNKTAKLASVEIVRPAHCVGETTVEGMQAGLYYSQLGAVREITKRISDEKFSQQDVVVLATGGFAHLFSEENLFHKIMPDLVLHGLVLVTSKNPHCQAYAGTQ